MKKIIICILLFLSLQNNIVNATEGKYVPDKLDYEVHMGKHRVFYKKYIEVSGKSIIAYCVAPNSVANPDSVYSNKQAHEYDVLIESTKRELALIAYFGYGYENRNSDLWYAVTQSMIWNVLEGEKPKIYDKAGKLINYDTYEAQIIKDISDYKKKMEYTLNSKRGYKHEKINLQINTKNQILLDEEKIGNPHKIDLNQLKKGENKLKIEEIQTPNRNIKLETGQFWTKEGSQDFMSITEIQNKNVEIDLEVLEYGNLEILKKGEDGSFLKGVEFSFYLDNNMNGVIDENDTLIDTQKTDDAGKIFVGDIVQGKYLVIENETIDGYVKSDKTHVVEIKNGQTGYIEIENMFKKYEVSISKIDYDTSEIIPGATLALYQEDTEIAVFKSANDPYEINLKPGAYQICEIEAPVDYQLASECISFEVDGEDLKIDFKNKKQLIETGVKNNYMYGISFLFILFLIKYGNKMVHKKKN